MDGVYTADPRSVTGAQRIEELGLDAALDMAQAGSKVLLAEALSQAKAHGVTLTASATHQAAGTGTRVSPDPIEAPVVGIATDTDLYLLHSTCDLTPFAGAIRTQLPDGQVVVDGRNLPPPESWSTPGQPIATVSAIGASVVSDPTTTAAAVAAVASVHPGPLWWTSGQTFTAITPRDLAPSVEAALHAILLESGR